MQQGRSVAKLPASVASSVAVISRALKCPGHCPAAVQAGKGHMLQPKSMRLASYDRIQ
jgi:hypothetical protein